MSLYLEPVSHRLMLFDHHVSGPISLNFDLHKQRGSVVLKSFLNGLVMIVKEMVQ